ncbi:MAG: hypothetical protein F6K00_13690 [Leptolyngbya sp. SIOISBB]|nr:hypothetical protein [Leptolyngbya sp. SIOISBB]
MARSLDQISADLVKLDAATQGLDQNLQAVYQDYLATLGQAVKRQLILATYHLCTQTYPEEFLALTVAQREQFQANLRQLSSQGKSQIMQLGQMTNLAELTTQLEEAVVAKYGAIESDADDASEESSEDLHASAEAITEPQIAAIEATAEVPDDLIVPTEASSTASDSEPLGKASDKASAMLKRLSTSLSLFSIFEAEPLTPVSLAKRHVLLERHLRTILRTLSSLANHALKQVKVLPDLPEMVIAAATEADGDNTGPSMPNLVSVLVEVADRHHDDDQNDAEESEFEANDETFEEADPDHDMTHLVAINLRLADIEFADHQTALWRGRLQETLQKLKRLGRQYQTLQQEKAQAEAEHAWRAVWFEE